MKVLVIDEWLPYPLDSGKKIRTFNMITRLARKFEILYIAYANLPSEREKATVMENHGVRVIPVKDIRIKKWTMHFYISVALNVFSSHPFSTAYHIKDPFIKKLQEVLKAERPALVHCEWTNLSPFLAHATGFPTVIAAHNVESDIWDRLAKNASKPWMRLLGRQQAIKIGRLEREWYPRADHCIAVSEEDAKVIAGYGAHVTVVENGVDLRYYETRPKEVSQNHLVFVASLDVFTNQDAVHFFIQKVFPLITAKNPSVHLWIVGKDPPEAILRYSGRDGRIHVTGTVPDVREYLARSSICIVPIRIGGGSRLKILEAMAMKKPVVSTSVGAEGLRVADGENILMADRPEDFADKILWLMARPDRQKSLGEAGWRLVKSHYGWDGMAQKQDSIWRAVGHGHAPTAVEAA